MACFTTRCIPRHVCGTACETSRLERSLRDMFGNANQQVDIIIGGRAVYLGAIPTLGTIFVASHLCGQ